MTTLVKAQVARLESLGFTNINDGNGWCEIVRGEKTVKCEVNYDGGKYWVSVAWKWRGYEAPEPPKFRFCVDSRAKVPEWKLDKLFALGTAYLAESQAYADAAEAEAAKVRAFREETAQALRPVFCSLSEAVPQTWDEAEDCKDGFSRYGSEGKPFRKFQVVRYASGIGKRGGYSVSIAASELTAEKVAALAKAFAEVLGKEGE